MGTPTGDAAVPISLHSWMEGSPTPGCGGPRAALSYPRGSCSWHIVILTWGNPTSTTEGGEGVEVGGYGISPAAASTTLLVAPKRVVHWKIACIGVGSISD
jgi:hypothetical protein